MTSEALKRYMQQTLSSVKGTDHNCNKTCNETCDKT